MRIYSSHNFRPKTSRKLWIIAFDCVLNRIDAEQRQISRAVSELYGRHRVIGFNTYGEQYHALHVNQTFSGLAIGK